MTSGTLMCICLSALMSFANPGRCQFTHLIFILLIWILKKNYLEYNYNLFFLSPTYFFHFSFSYIFFHLNHTLGTLALLFTDLLVTFCQTVPCWTVTDCSIVLILRCPCAKWLHSQSSLFGDSEVIRFHSASIWYQSLLCENCPTGRTHGTLA